MYRLASLASTSLMQAGISNPRDHIVIAKTFPSEWKLGVGTILVSKQPNHSTALLMLDKSLALYPRERACLAAAQCCIQLGQWAKAKTLLERTARDFPAGDRKTIDEARRLLPTVLKRMAEPR